MGASDASASNAAAAAPSEGDAAEAERVRAQIEQLKRSQHALSQALAEKTDLAARIKSARLALEGGGADAANSGDLGGSGAAEGERSGGVPGFGRRAPNVSRQQSALDAAASPVAGGALSKMPSDNLGQVTPLGVTSSGSEASPANAQRPPSSGRRRSRLAESAKDEGGDADGGE